MAAFIAEPIQGVGGFITPPKEYFQIAVGIVRNHGGLFICDEVQTGWGRTGDHWFGIQHWGVEPDIMTMAKSIASGFAIRPPRHAGVGTGPHIGAEYFFREIAKVQASSGMSIDIHWQRADAGGTTLRRALELLQASPSRLTPDEQRRFTSGSPPAKRSRSSNDRGATHGGSSAVSVRSTTNGSRSARS